jgi:YggT family protein
MRSILDIVLIVLDLYWWIIIGSAVFSWLFAFNVVNMSNQFVGAVANFLHQMTEPLLRPIRKIMPNLGTIDLSPIILLLGVIFAQSIIVRYIYPNVF